jgi:hypothetical protein
LLMDLFVGIIEYRQKLDLLSGWVHHICYVIFLSIIYQYGWSNSFASCLICEVPTLAIAFGNICVNRRLSNKLIAIVFFLTRIVWCIIIAGMLIIYGEGYIRQITSLFILLLHSWWYMLMKKS